MFARVNEFTGSTAELEAGRAQSDEISRKLGAIPGSLGLYFMIDREAGKALSITLWESEEAMRASEQEAAQIREDSAREAGTQVMRVGHYEVLANTARAAV